MPSELADFSSVAKIFCLGRPDGQQDLRCALLASKTYVATCLRTDLLHLQSLLLTPKTLDATSNSSTYS